MGTSETGMEAMTLFVSSPKRGTVTLRGLPRKLNIEDLQAVLEIEAGIPVDCYKLEYGEKVIQGDDNLELWKNIRNCAVLKVVWLEEYAAYCNAVTSGPEAVRLLLEEQVAITDVDNQSKKLFTAAYMACYHGENEVLQLLLANDASLLNGKTRYRRTLAHASTAKDQANTLAYLLEQGCEICTEAHFYSTPLDVAMRRGSYLCQRIFRNYFAKRRMTKSAKKDSKSLGMSPCIKECIHNESILERDLNKDKLSPRDTNVDHITYSESSYKDQRLGTITPATANIIVYSRSSKRPRSSQKSKRPMPSLPKELPSHTKCAQPPPFMAFRNIPFEELNPEIIEYVPLETMNYRQRSVYNCNQNKTCSVCADGDLLDSVSRCDGLDDSVGSPLSGLGRERSVTWADMNSGGKGRGKKVDVKRCYTRPAQATSFRVQSANYYRTRYHIEAETDSTLPKARPATAGPRYREWKTWLVEKYKQEEEKLKFDAETEERRMRNLRAFNDWLAKKTAERNYESGEESEEETPVGRREALAEKMFKIWIEKVRREKEKNKPPEPLEQIVEDKPTKKAVKLSTAGDVGDKDPIEQDDSNTNMFAYQIWLEQKKEYEAWKRKKGLPVENVSALDKNDLQATRDLLSLNGITYHEWLGQKHREKKSSEKLCS